MLTKNEYDKIFIVRLLRYLKFKFENLELDVDIENYKWVRCFFAILSDFLKIIVVSVIFQEVASSIDIIWFMFEDSPLGIV